MTTDEAAARLGVSRSRVLKMLDPNKPRLRSERIGRMHLIPRSEVERLIREQKRQATTGKKPGPLPNVLRNDDA